MERERLPQYSRAIGLLKSIELREELNRDKSVRQEVQSWGNTGTRFPQDYEAEI